MDGPSRPVTGYPATGYPPPEAHPSTNPTGYPSATAYPYPAPPPTQAPYYNPNPYYYNNNPNPNPNSYSSQHATFLRRLFAILIASFIITGTIVFIIWLVIRPRLPQLRVDSVSLSRFNVSSASLVTGDWDVRFTVRNPNHKMVLYYDQIEAYVFYKSVNLAGTAVPPFDQDTKNQTSMRATFAASSAYVDPRVSNDVKEDQTRGTVEFNVRMLVRMRFEAGAWRARRRFLRVFCGDLTVGVKQGSNGGALVGGSKECRVGI